jgi:membrane protein involved in colicin uptake
MATAKPTKLVVDCSTGHVEEVELTDEEIAQREADAAAYAEAEAVRQAEEEAKAEAKASAEAKLTALGLTAEEIAALKA